MEISNGEKQFFVFDERRFASHQRISENHPDSGIAAGEISTPQMRDIGGSPLLFGINRCQRPCFRMLVFIAAGADPYLLAALKQFFPDRIIIQ